MTASCGGDDAEPGSPAPAASAPTASEEPAAAGSTNVLIGTIGTPEDPDAYELFLTDSSGEPVTELPAGEYEIQVNDPSEIHNFHLQGGDVEEMTTVPETGEVTWTVELTEGDYTAICDPHPSMRAEFTVV